jgi:pimeloyl-ACP methyl ester carboxylesterase
MALALLLTLLLAPLAAIAAPDELACNQQPGNRFFWLERAFCDLPAYGPERANGAVIWNHGISGTTQSWMAPAPPALRLLQARGWDVVMLKRHHAAEGSNTLYRTVQRALEEARALKKAGYRKVALAGQSFGGYVALEAIDTSPDIDAAIALAPGVRSTSAAGRLDASVTDRLLQTAKVGRLALVFPKNDDLFNYQVRGASAQSILSRRALPYLLFDETTDITGHGGGITGRFALRYGPCLADFLAAANPPGTRFTCAPVADEWPTVRELLMPAGSERPTLVQPDPALSPTVSALLGYRYAVLGDSLVLVAPVDGGAGQLRLLYTSTGFKGGVVDAVVKEGAIHATLANKATVVLKPEGDGVLSWTAADRARTLEAPLVRGRDPE